MRGRGAASILAAALCLQGAAAADGAVDITPSQGERSRTTGLAVAPGASVAFDLQFNAGTPGLWTCTVDRPDVVALADLGSAPLAAHPPGMVGTRQRHRFSATARSDGTATVTCARVFLKETVSRSVLRIEVR